VGMRLAGCVLQDGKRRWGGHGQRDVTKTVRSAGSGHRGPG
jgi:hypothetical protein